MKKFIIKTGIIGLLPFILLFIGYLVVPVKENHWLRSYEKKCALLEKTPPPRVIFVGGSNIGFGLDSRKIIDSLNLNVVNYGIAYDIGLKFMIDDIETYVRKNDILVFVPEWQQFYNMMYGGNTQLTTIIKLGGINKFQILTIQQIINVIKGIPEYLKQNLLPQNVTEKTYLVSNFNEYGDEEKHWAIDNDFRSKPKPITDKFDKEFGKYFIDKLNKLQTKCTVVMMPPACCSIAMKKWDKQVKEVEEYLKQNGHPFILDPHSCSFAEEYMYDSDYHLNKKGVDLRTSLVIDALKQVLPE